MDKTHNKDSRKFGKSTQERQKELNSTNFLIALLSIAFILLSVLLIWVLVIVPNQGREIAALLTEQTQTPTTTVTPTETPTEVRITNVPTVQITPIATLDINGNKSVVVKEKKPTKTPKPTKTHVPTQTPTETPIWDEIGQIRMKDPSTVDGKVIAAEIRTIIDMTKAQIIIVPQDKQAAQTASTAVEQDPSVTVVNASDTVEVVSGNVTVPDSGPLKSPCAKGSITVTQGFLAGLTNVANYGDDLLCGSGKVVAPGNMVVVSVINRNLTSQQDQELKQLDAANDWSKEPAAKYGCSGIVVMASANVDGERLYFLFCHLKIGSVVVTPGQQLQEGEEIALMGNTGYVIGGPTSDGSHLHYGICAKPEAGYGEKDFRNPALYNAEVERTQ